MNLDCAIARHNLLIRQDLTFIFEGFSDIIQTILKKIQDIRTSYQKATLEENMIPAHPSALFDQWWEAALHAEVPEPNAMTLATVNAEGYPSARIVLLKEASEDGFSFFTNHKSRKATDIQANPNVALVFHWQELERQVRIEGVAEMISYEASQAYFQSRPRGSQIGAWSSPQSQVIPGRVFLEERVDLVSEEYINVDPLPCPPYWGGYLVRPHTIEFWQGRPDRLHDRFRYRKNEETGEWAVERLAP